MPHVYSRSSTASQSLLRQRHILTEAGLLVRAEDVAGGFRPAGGVKLYEDPATTSSPPRWTGPRSVGSPPPRTPAAAASRRAFGRFLRELRKGWAGRRASCGKTGAASGRATVTREVMSRWEHGTGLPGPFWTAHLAAVLQVPLYVLEDMVRRRDMMMLTGVTAVAALAGTAAGPGARTCSRRSPPAMTGR